MAIIFITIKRLVKRNNMRRQEVRNEILHFSLAVGILIYT